MEDLAKQFYKVELHICQTHATIVKRNKQGKPVYGLRLVRNEHTNKILEELTYLFNFIYNVLDLPTSRTNGSYLESAILCHMVRKLGVPIGKKRLLNYYYNGELKQHNDIPVPKKSINKGRHNQFYRGRHNQFYRGR